MLSQDMRLQAQLMAVTSFAISNESGSDIERSSTGPCCGSLCLAHPMEGVISQRLFMKRLRGRGRDDMTARGQLIEWVQISMACFP